MTDVTICRIDPETGAFDGETKQVSDLEGCPIGWVLADPPSDPAEGHWPTWSGGDWVEIEIPPVDLEPLRQAAIEQVGKLRWEATLFFQYDGSRAWADSALGAVIGIVVGAQILPPTGPQNFKLGPGVFRLWTVEQITAYGIAIRAHIQACFDREAELTAAVMAATTAEDIMAIAAEAQGGWPQ